MLRCAGAFTPWHDFYDAPGKGRNLMVQEGGAISLLLPDYCLSR